MKVTVTAIERDLRSLLAGDVEFDAITRHLYATDAGINQITPLGVVSPRDVEDVVRLVRYASEHGIPLVPRGMGSGLAGGAVGAGVQVDFTRYMHNILEIADDASWVRVQPGLVMGVLNRQLKRHGVFFAPDPSSEDYCSLGGMISNNSSGARTVAYGGTKDHLLAADVVLAGGELFQAAPLRDGSDQLAQLVSGGSMAGKAFDKILPVLRDKAEAITASMPRVVKNCSGYRIETIFSGNTVNLQKMFVGAEGTLGLVVEAKLNLVPLPGERGITMAYFPSVFSACETVPGILALKPSSVEIMDARFLSFVRSHYSQLDAMLPLSVDTALLIEFEGRDDAELDDRLPALERHLATRAATAVKRAASAAEQDQLWTVRKSAVPLLLRMPGPRRATPFIEDVTVHPDELAGYIDFLQKMFARRNVDAAIFGHAGDGNVHCRPMLDPKNAEDLRSLQGIYDEVSDYVLAIKGTMSGEHGDGLLRSPYVRRMYGDEIYGIFETIKGAFDPLEILNPGKKIAPPGESGGLARNLRYGTDYWTFEQHPILNFPENEFEHEIEKCHGCGQCKSLVATTMCPTFKATHREHASPRAKANLLRNIITGRLDPESTYALTAAKEVTDYCIVCGMCAVECPSRVNIPKLMLEAKSKYRAAHPGTPVDWTLGHAEMVSQAGHLAAPLANRLLNQGMLRRAGERIVGIDRRRTMAPFARRTFAQIVAARGDVYSEWEAEGNGNAALPPALSEPGTTAGPSGSPASTGTQSRGPTVALFYDVFANYNDPQLALIVEDLLKSHGVRVVFPDQKASGIPEMLYGYAKRAQAAASYNLERVLPFVKNGCVLISSEPTATFAFKVHYPDYVSSPECSEVANATRDLGEFLVRLRTDRPESSPQAGPLRLRVGYHQPCHLKAQQIGNPGLALLGEIPELELVNLDSGCCGMAGTFGMKADTFDFSMRTGKPLFDKIAETAPDLVASECSTCRMQIGAATGIPTAHPVELLAKAYGLPTVEGRPNIPSRG